MAGSLTKVEAFASQMWLKIQLLETLAKVGGLDNCSLLISKQLYLCDDTYKAKFDKNNANPHKNFV